MKFTVKKASRMWHGEIAEEVDINTLEELEEVAKKHARDFKKEDDRSERVVVDFNNNEIIIYDYYLE